MTVPPVGSTSQPSPTPPVKITQPDGSSYDYTPPSATYDPNSGTWVKTTGTGMDTLAKQVNRKHGQSLDGDDFMKLLIAQLRYQDPTKPADTAAMMQQTASMAMLERVNELTDSAEAMSKAAESMVAASDKVAKSNEAMGTYYSTSMMEQRMSTAVGLIGAKVAYADPSDGSRTLDGLVESVRFDESGPILSVSGKDVPLGSIKSVTHPAAPPANGPAATDSTPTTDAPASTPAPADGTTTNSGNPPAASTATDGTPTPAGSPGTTPEPAA